MKVLALISGGKDSITNIIKCKENGHEIIALANLYNESKISKFNNNIVNGKQGEQADSYMYQTVGTNITLYISDVMGKPIYRKKIVGKPMIKTLEYNGDNSNEEKKGDQVEDLDSLVQEIIKKHPEINAISSGAIYSTYQKLRVENICKRYGLISLAYLWQSNQIELLKQMIDRDIHAVIIKVASYGLKKEHLGKTIKELYPLFLKLQKQCGMNVCGEGGQYESLVLDCQLYQKRISIDQFEVIEVDKNQLAPVAYLKINSVVLVDK